MLINDGIILPVGFGGMDYAERAFNDKETRYRQAKIDTDRKKTGKQDHKGRVLG